MVRRTVQILFLTAFVGLIIVGKVQLWMVLFVGGLIGALLFGRLYCGWICPINTITEGTDRLYGRLGISRWPVPGWLKTPVTRYGVVVLFLALMIITVGTGRKLPVLPALTVIGVSITVLFVPALWHRHLCPYGTLLSLPGAVSRTHRRISPDDCVNCGICQRVCPGEAVISGDPAPSINRGLCLECAACARACPRSAIHHSWTERDDKRD